MEEKKDILYFGCIDFLLGVQEYARQSTKKAKAELDRRFAEAKAEIVRRRAERVGA